MNALLLKSSQPLVPADLSCNAGMNSTARPRRHRQKSTVVCIGSSFAPGASRGGYSIIVSGKPELNETVLVDVRSERGATLSGILAACEKAPQEKDLTIILDDRELIRDLNNSNGLMWQDGESYTALARSLLNVTMLKKIAAHRILRRVNFTSKGHASKLEYCTFLAEWRLKGWIS